MQNKKLGGGGVGLVARVLVKKKGGQCGCRTQNHVKLEKKKKKVREKKCVRSWI